MIRVQRQPAPHIIADNADQWTEELCQDRTSYYIRRQLIGKPEPLPQAKRNRYGHNVVKRALRVMFGTKCCYCEAKVDAVSHRHVEHFRPQSIYPALAYRWSNLLFACERCNSDSKRDKFPLAPNEVQAQPNQAAPCALVGDDDAMLIDPCVDDPNEHFAYAFDYRPDSDFIDVSLVCKTRRGQLSRDICGLTRPDLVDDQREHLLNIQNAIDGYLLAAQTGHAGLRRQYERRLQKAMASTSPYSALTKAYLQHRGIDL